MHSWRYLLLVFASFLCLSHASLPTLDGVASAQSSDVAALVRQFFEAVNRGDAAAAAALFSDDANYTAWAACQSGCKDRAEIVDAIRTQLVAVRPGTISLEQSCGDTAAVVSQNSDVPRDRYILSTFRASGGRLTTHIRDPRGSLSLDEARAAAADVCAGVKPLILPAGATSAQDPDNAAVLARFFDRVNNGDSRGAAALFSDSATYKGYGSCYNTCTDRADIQSALAQNLRLSAPYGVTVEQVCGDTMVALTLPAAQAASKPEAAAWNVAVFSVRAGRIFSYQAVQSPVGLNLSDARAAAAKACGVVTPAPPAQFNKGGLVHIDTRISLWLSAVLVGVVVTVLLSVFVHLFRRLRRPA